MSFSNPNQTYHTYKIKSDDTKKKKKKTTLNLKELKFSVVKSTAKERST
jgi:hypothetical protein